MNYPSFEKFKDMALSESLTKYEKIGFGGTRDDSIDEDIFLDINYKLQIDERSGLKVLDVGCGCTRLLKLIREVCNQKDHTLHLIDSKEMLSLNDHPKALKHCGKFPFELESFINEHAGSFDIIICYSVLHHIFEDPAGNVVKFVDQLVKLLSNSGKLLIGDIPNTSKQNRFINSPKGKKMHQLWNLPTIKHEALEECRIDDGFIFYLLSRYRNNGYNTYLLPLHENLPFKHVREDILIK
jgi:2-polyprenyl-3-methyl-5-hydroxy-6-metoxy-1,4-benzoquinol methylase